MLANEKNHVAIAFVTGALIGAIAVWGLAKSGTLKIGADLTSPDLTLEECLADLGYRDVNGDGIIDGEDYPNNGNFDSDFSYCLEIAVPEGPREVG